MTLIDVALWTSLAIAVAVVALVVLRLASRRVARRHAERLGVELAPGFCHFQKTLTLSPRAEETVDHGWAALATLPGRPEIEANEGPVPELVARTAAGEQSFGEVVSIRVAPTAAGRSEVRVRSRPKRLQLFDGGTNAGNVAEIARELAARAAIAGDRQADAPEDDDEEEVVLFVSDWLALGYLVLVAGYTAGLLWLAHQRPDSFEAWVALVETLAINPSRLLGELCPSRGLAREMLIDRQLDLLIWPTLVLYGIYNYFEFRRGRERMGGLNWLLALTSLVVLPLLLATSCSPAWREAVLANMPDLLELLLHYGAGGVIHAVMLVIFCNGLSFLPAAALARLLPRRERR